MRIAATRRSRRRRARKIEIAKLRPQKDGFIAVLKGVTDRNAAEALKGTELFVPRDACRRPDAGRSLRGRPHRPAAWCSPTERCLGEIVDVANYGAGDLIDVKIEGRRDTVLIPFATGFVQEADGHGHRRRPARGVPRRGGAQTR